MLKKLAALLFATLLALHALAPSVVFANESDYETEELMATEDAYEVRISLDEEIRDEEVGALEVQEGANEDDIEPWTDVQMVEWYELRDENWARQDHIARLLFFAEGKFDITEFEEELFELQGELWNLMDAVDADEPLLSFTAASAALIENTMALESLATRIEDLGVVVLPPYAIWTFDQVEDWAILQEANWMIITQIRGLQIDAIEEEYFTFAEFREKFGDLLDEFVALEIESSQIANDAHRSFLTFEVAVALLEANTMAFEDLFERFEIAIDEAIHGIPNPPTPPVGDGNDDESDDENDNSTGNNLNNNEPTLPQTGAEATEIALAGIGFIAVGIIIVITKNKKKQFSKKG